MTTAEPDTADARLAVRRGGTVVDVGARRGATAVPFARAVGPAGRVVAYEPVPVSCARLAAVLTAEGLTNVTIRPLALAAAPGGLAMAVPRTASPAYSSAEPAIRAGLLADGAASLVVEATTLDAEVAAGTVPAPDLVKIDVEGLEADVLRGMAATLLRHRPEVFVEMHGAGADAKRARAAEVIGLLLEAGYDVEHAESGRVVRPGDAALAAEGHLHARPAITAP